MADAQTLRQVAQTRTPFSTWLGVVLLFLMFGLIVLAIIGPSARGTDYEEKRAANRLNKLKAQHEQDQAALTGYAWVDKAKGTVRIPIDKAIQITATELAAKKPSAAGPIATPPAAQPAAADTGAPPASPSPSLTPKGMEVEAHGSKAQPAAGRTPPGAAPGTQPGPFATPAASLPPVAVPPSSPPAAATPAPSGSPLPVRGSTPGSQ